MIVTEREKEVSAQCSRWRSDGLTVALVPTMGALHQGHLSLVRKAVEESDRVVVSIFVNPTQFAENEDLDRYPRTLREDSAALEKLGVSLLFAPSQEVIYPSGFSTVVHVTGVSEGLCGEYRPGHFDGVATVCAVLFGIVKPDFAVFGMKDAQQLSVIRRMATDLRIGTKIIGLPTVREPDGLAMSSRNSYLTDRQRKEAARIHRGLVAARDRYRSGERNCSVLRDTFEAELAGAHELRIQYVETVDPVTMRRVERATDGVMMAVAVFAGETRLIDNILFDPEV